MTLKEKSEKELAELLVKFRKQGLLGGPLRNKLKNLQATKAKLEGELDCDGGSDEAGSQCLPEALSAVIEARRAHTHHFGCSKRCVS